MYITSALQKTDMKAVGLQLALDLLHQKVILNTRSVSLIDCLILSSAFIRKNATWSLDWKPEQMPAARIGTKSSNKCKIRRKAKLPYSIVALHNWLKRFASNAINMDSHLGKKYSRTKNWIYLYMKLIIWIRIPVPLSIYSCLCIRVMRTSNMITIYHIHQCSSTYKIFKFKVICAFFCCCCYPLRVLGANQL